MATAAMSSTAGAGPGAAAAATAMAVADAPSPQETFRSVSRDALRLLRSKEAVISAKAEDVVDDSGDNVDIRREATKIVKGVWSNGDELVHGSRLYHVMINLVLRKLEVMGAADDVVISDDEDDANDEEENERAEDIMGDQVGVGSASGGGGGGGPRKKAKTGEKKRGRPKAHVGGGGGRGCYSAARGQKKREGLEAHFASHTGCEKCARLAEHHPKLLKFTEDMWKFSPDIASAVLSGALAGLTSLPGDIASRSPGARRMAEKRKQHGSEPKTSVQYSVLGHNVCQKTFCAVFGVSVDTIHRRLAEMQDGEMVHVRRGHRGSHYQDRLAPKEESVVTWMTAFAEVNGEPCPDARVWKKGREQHIDKVLNWLGADTLPEVRLLRLYTKSDLHRMYESAAASTEDIESVGYSHFVTTINRYLPHIRVGEETGRTDYCNICSKMRLNGLCGSHPHTLHRRHAAALRAVYRGSLRECRRAIADAVLASDDKIAVAMVTLDFAEAVSVPRLHDQTGTLFFKSELKVDILMIRDEATGQQYNYLITETRQHTLKNSPKTPACVISMLEHFLSHHATPGTRLVIQMDNCTAQNKNHCMMRYASWLVATERYEEVDLRFMLVGHTKFAPDAGAGLFKRHINDQIKHRGVNLLYPSQVAEMINASAEWEHAVVAHDGFPWYECVGYFKQFFASHPGIQKVFDFHFFGSDEGVFVERCDYTGARGEAMPMLLEGVTLDDVRRAPASKFRRPAALPRRHITAKRRRAIASLLQVYPDESIDPFLQEIFPGEDYTDMKAMAKALPVAATEEAERKEKLAAEMMKVVLAEMSPVV